MASPTKSWRKYIQAVGRGVRLHPGKDKCIFLDCANAIDEHGLPTDKRKFIFKAKISRIIDRELNIENYEGIKTSEVIPEHKKMFLRKIGSLLDLYDGKIYTKENDLQDDVNRFLEKTDWFWWRQNSGKMFRDNRWIHFASKSGLPDSTLFYNMSSIYIGIELKLRGKGRLTDHQKQTLPEMVQKGCFVFFAHSVYEVYQIIKHVEINVNISNDGVFVKNSIYNLPEWQKKHYKKYFKKLLPEKYFI